MAHGQTDSCLDDGNASAHEHSREEQRGPFDVWQLAVFSPCSIALRWTEPMISTALPAAATSAVANFGTRSGASARNTMTPAAAAIAPPAREGQISAQRDDRDAGSRGCLRAEGAGGGREREQQRKPQGHQRGERIPVVEGPAEPAGGSRQKGAGLLRRWKQVRAQSRDQR